MRASVGVAVIIALTLTPALLGFAGERLRPRRRRTSGGAPVEPHGRRFFAGWVRTATRAPVVTILAVVAVLGLAAVPAARLNLALPDAGSQPAGTEARVTYDLISKHFGPGWNGRLIVTATIIGSTDPLGLMNDLKTEIEALPGVAAVPLATPNQNADTGIVQVIPETGPESAQTADLVREIRSHRAEWQAKYGVDIAVTGITAIAIDISTRLGNALLPFGLFVVGLSFVLLTMVFRSLWVPVKAALGYLLSVGASFGVVVLVFQDGWGASLLGLDRTGPVISFLPILLMGVLFGLAMDYEVFLVSRIREEYVHGGDARAAIRTGFVHSATVVTAAAAIMFSVFAAFVPEGDVNIKPIALGLAVGRVRRRVRGADDAGAGRAPAARRARLALPAPAGPAAAALRRRGRGRGRRAPARGLARAGRHGRRGRAGPAARRAGRPVLRRASPPACRAAGRSSWSAGTAAVARRCC